MAKSDPPSTSTQDKAAPSPDTSVESDKKDKTELTNDELEKASGGGWDVGANTKI